MLSKTTKKRLTRKNIIRASITKQSNFSTAKIIGVECETSWLYTFN